MDYNYRVVEEVLGSGQKLYYPQVKKFYFKRLLGECLFGWVKAQPDVDTPWCWSVEDACKVLSIRKLNDLSKDKSKLKRTVIHTE